MKKNRRQPKANSSTIVKSISNKAQQEFVDKAASLVESLCEAQGIELVYVEYQREAGGRILRIYIDKPGGIKLDDCVSISRELNDLIDVQIDNDFSYNLEVSSPGSNRPLWKKQDFQRFNGYRVKVRMHHPLDVVEGQKKITGVLEGMSEEYVKVSLDNRTVAIPFEEISRANLIDYKVDLSTSPGK